MSKMGTDSTGDNGMNSIWRIRGPPPPLSGDAVERVLFPHSIITIGRQGNCIYNVTYTIRCKYYYCGQFS